MGIDADSGIITLHAVNLIVYFLLETLYDKQILFREEH